MRGRCFHSASNEQHIGDADGRIALWLNERSAYDLAALFRHDDLGFVEIMEAISRAYPSQESEIDPSKGEDDAHEGASRTAGE